MKGKIPKFIPDNRGLIRSVETKTKISNTLKKKGIKPPRCPIEKVCRGKNHPWWRGGITKINEKIRKSFRYKTWRRNVFKRDNYTCVWCGYKGKRIIADHIKQFATFPKLRFVVKNGRTLCCDCHKKTDTYGKNVWGNEV